MPGLDVTSRGRGKDDKVSDSDAILERLSKQVDGPERCCGAPRSPEWPAVRAKHLLEQPSCRVCGSVAELNVHHVRPFHLYPKLELVDDNLITLCEGHECHFQFGHLCSWQSWNVSVHEDAEKWLSKVQHRPE